jgi:hypothetical protein
MDGKPLPLEWMKQPVRVGLSTVGPGGESETLGTLDTVNEHGIILLQRGKEGERRVFYTWGCIAWVHHTEEQQKPHLGARIGGPSFPGGNPNKP